jgi:hypothetical protein
MDEAFKFISSNVEEILRELDWGDVFKISSYLEAMMTEEDLDALKGAMVLDVWSSHLDRIMTEDLDALKRRMLRHYRM